MRMKIFYLAIVVLLMSGLISQGFCMANRPPASKKSTSKQVEPIQKISGRVSGYSWSNSTITIATVSGDSITAEIEKSTRISKSGKRIKMTDVKTGDTVTVNYETKDGKKIARTIIVRQKAAPKAAIPEKKKR